MKMLLNQDNADQQNANLENDNGELQNVKDQQDNSNLKDIKLEQDKQIELEAQQNYLGNVGGHENKLEEQANADDEILKGDSPAVEVKKDQKEVEPVENIKPPAEDLHHEEKKTEAPEKASEKEIEPAPKKAEKKEVESNADTASINAELDELDLKLESTMPDYKKCIEQVKGSKDEAYCLDYIFNKKPASSIPKYQPEKNTREQQKYRNEKFATPGRSALEEDVEKEVPEKPVDDHEINDALLRPAFWAREDKEPVPKKHEIDNPQSRFGNPTTKYTSGATKQYSGASSGDKYKHFYK